MAWDARGLSGCTYGFLKEVKPSFFQKYVWNASETGCTLGVPDEEERVFLHKVVLYFPCEEGSVPCVKISGLMGEEQKQFKAVFECDPTLLDDLKILRTKMYALGPKHVHEDSSHIPSHGVMEEGYWDRDIWRSSEKHADFYRRVHAWAVSQMVEHVRLFESEKVRVLDAGCGSGELLDAMQKTRVEGKTFSYSAFDFNSSNVRHVAQSQEHVSVFRDDIAVMRCFEGEKFDVITCLGVLTHQVLSQEQSVQGMRQLYKALSQEGVLILSGLSYSYFSKKHFEQMGFEVLCCLRDDVLLNENAFGYVLKKKPRDILEKELDQALMRASYTGHLDLLWALWVSEPWSFEKLGVFLSQHRVRFLNIRGSCFS